MRHSSSALRLIAVLVTMAATTAAQLAPKPQDLPDAPVAKQENAPQKRQNRFNTTIEVLERRSIFFPSIATGRGALSSKQKFELFGDQSGAEFAGRIWPGYGWIRETLRLVDGYGRVDQFFWNVCHFVAAAS